MKLELEDTFSNTVNMYEPTKVEMEEELKRIEYSGEETTKNC